MALVLGGHDHFGELFRDFPRHYVSGRILVQDPAMIQKQVKITLWGIFVLAMFATLDAILNVLLSRWLPIIPV